MKKFVKENLFLIQFFGGGLLCYAIWYLGYENYLAPAGDFDWAFNRSIANQVAAYFSLWGYEAKVVSYQIYPHLMYLNNEPIMSVDTPCNGLPMIYLFSSFILVYAGPWKRKFGFIAFGVFTIHLLNIIRIIGLSYISIYSPDYFYFNHKYMFQIIVYSVILSFWLYWILYGQEEKTSLKSGIRQFITLKFLSNLFTYRTIGSKI